MSRETHERAAHLAALLARKSPLPASVIARHVTQLQRIAKQAKAAEVNRCNVPGFDYEGKLKRLAGHAASACKAMGVSIALGGDPCGPCCWLKIPGERGDGMDPDSGIAVY